MRRDGKRSKRFVFGLCAAVAALVVFACQAKTAELAGWSKRAEIVVQGNPQAGLVEFALAPEVYAAARPDLGDLLVTDAAGQVVPHILRQETGSVTQEKRLAPASIINRVHSPKQFSAAVLDFGTPLLKSGVEIDTAGENFRRQVKVEASDDGQTWQVLKKSAWLFRIGAGRGADDRKRVELPDNNFRFLRVTVFHAPDDPEEVEIVSAVAWQVTKKSTPPDLVEWKIASLQIHTDEEVSKTTTVDIDVGYENLPFYAIELTVADENFMRSAEVLGRNRTTRVIETRVEDGPMRSTEVEEPWQHIATGTIHRFTAAGETDECLRLEANAGGGWRYLRVRIFNHDNPPLQISSARVWGINRYVVCAAKQAARYLYFGNPSGQPRHHDFPAYAQRLRQEGVTSATLGVIGPNPDFSPAPGPQLPWSEQHKHLIWLALIAVLAVLGLLIWRQAKSIPPGDSDQSANG